MFNLTGYWSLLYQVPIGLLGLSFLVFIHEAGHFLVAKALKVRVNTFSIGFGKKILRYRRGETEYCISAIPFGGYVAMAGENPDEADGDTPPDGNEFSAKPVPVRMAIAFAGPAVNIGFSVLLLFFLYMWGVQEPKNSMVVGEVEPDSPAAEAGVERGDVIVSLAGQPVRDWEALLQEIAVRGENPVKVAVERDGAVEDLTLTPRMNPRLGIAMAGIFGEGEVYVHSIIPNRPAAGAGMQAGDKILQVEGVKVPSATALIEIINKSQGREISLLVEREGEESTLQVTPELDEGTERYVIGIFPAVNIPTVLVKRSAGESFSRAVNRNLEFGTAIFKTLKGIITGQIQAKALAGPIGILQMIASSLHYSVQRFAEFMALISTNLGVINLLPLAITDGGVILFLTLEAIRGRPIKPSTQMRINQVAVSFFIMLALFVTFHDILRIPWFLN